MEMRDSWHLFNQLQNWCILLGARFNEHNNKIVCARVCSSIGEQLEKVVQLY